MKNLSKKRIVIVMLAIAALLILPFLLGGCGNSKSDNQNTETTNNESTNEAKNTEQETEPIELKFVTALAANTINGEMANALTKVVNEKGGGKIKIKFLGGPEVVPPSELAEAVRNGSVDLAFLPGGYYHSLIPEAEVLTYTDYTYDELKGTEAWNYLNKIHEEKGNIHLVDVQLIGFDYSIYTKKKISSLEDLKGYRLRVAPAHIPFAKAVGADIIDMPLGEIHSAMEKGIVDGFAFVKVGITDFGLLGQVSQMITPFIAKGDTEIIINNDVWNKIPEDLQEDFYQWVQEAETIVKNAADKKYEEELKEIEKLGIEEVNLGQELSEIATKAGWEHLKANTSQETYDKLKELFVKQK